MTLAKPILLLAAALCLGSFSGFAQQTLPKPADDLPEAAKTELWKRLRAMPGGKEERAQFCATILADARKLLAEHPGLPAVCESRDILQRMILLPAAEQLYRDAPTEENRDQLKKIAEEVVKFPVYDSSVYGDRRKPVGPGKAHAGYVLARLSIYPTPETKEPQEAEKHLRAMLEMFPAKAEVKGSDEVRMAATVRAAKLAGEAGAKALADELCAVIAEKGLAAPEALDVLSQLGHPATFEAEMSTLDGKKLSFPADTKGKVVLLDFWATWCGPCKASMPHIKQVYEKYQGKDVLVVGVCCDAVAQGEAIETNKKKVVDFLKQNQYVWTQAYSGEWPKSAIKYGIAGIPTVFLLDKEGKIVTAQARGQEERLIDEALK